LRPFAGLTATDAIGSLRYNTRMNSRPEIEAAQVDMSLAESEALNGVPQFYQIPEEVSKVIEKAVLHKERMFWLRATHIIKDIVNTTLLRRAIYAEQRCWEMESMAAEMAVITSGAADRVKELEKQLEDTVNAVR
jgi:hypothetical protein